MIEIYDPDDEARVLDALNSDSPGSFMRAAVWVSDIEVSDRMKDDTVGRDGDGVAQTINSTVAGILPLGVRGEPVYAVLSVNGVEILQYVGRALKPKVKLSDTEFTAVTPGHFLDNTELGGTLVYDRDHPASAVFEALSRADYDFSNVSVDDAEKPRFSRGVTASGAEDDSLVFTWADSVSDILSAVKEEADYFFRDNLQGGHTATLVVNPAEVREIAWEFIVGRDIDAESGFEYSGGVEGEYHSVVAITEESGLPVELARVEVPDAIAPPGVTYQVELSDDDAQNAWERVFEVANRLRLGEWEGTLNLDFIHPLLEEGDGISIVEPASDGDGAFIRTWYCVIENMTKSFANLTHNLKMSMSIVSEDRVEQSAASLLPGEVYDMRSLV